MKSSLPMFSGNEKKKVRTKVQLLREMLRFLKDEKRGISIQLFADMCGYSYRHMRDVFWYHTAPLTETMQIRVSRVLDDYIAGNIVVMEKYNRERYAEYRKEPKPVAKREYALTIKDGKIGLQIGLKARGDYTRPHLDELLDKKGK